MFPVNLRVTFCESSLLDSFILSFINLPIFPQSTYSLILFSPFLSLLSHLPSTPSLSALALCFRSPAFCSPSREVSIRCTFCRRSLVCLPVHACSPVPLTHVHFNSQPMRELVLECCEKQTPLEQICTLAVRHTQPWHLHLSHLVEGGDKRKGEQRGGGSDGRTAGGGSIKCKRGDNLPCQHGACDVWGCRLAGSRRSLKLKTRETRGKEFERGDCASCDLVEVASE